MASRSVNRHRFEAIGTGNAHAHDAQERQTHTDATPSDQSW